MTRPSRRPPTTPRSSSSTAAASPRPPASPSASGWSSSPPWAAPSPSEPTRWTCLPSVALRAFAPLRGLAGFRAFAAPCLVRVLERLDVELDHLQHGGHHPLRPLGVLVPQHLGEDVGDDLPGEPELVGDPAALLRRPALHQPVPVVI